jgi:hypothetical protein
MLELWEIGKLNTFLVFDIMARPNQYDFQNAIWNDCYNKSSKCNPSSNAIILQECIFGTQRK